jgi:uncharacterized protein (TIGR00288 family)
MKIAVFMDTQNLYFTLKKIRRSKLDYPKLMAHIEDIGEVVIANGYGFQMDNEAVPFITMLRAVGVTPKFSKKNEGTSVELACDVMKAIYNREIDLIVLVSSDGALTPLIRHAGHHNIKVMTMSATPSKEFEAAYECLELPSSVLRSI